jgi:hypothetical protein
LRLRDPRAQGEKLVRDRMVREICLARIEGIAKT